MAKKKNKNKKMARASMNLDNKYLKDMNLTKQVEVKSNVKKLIFNIGGVNSYEEIDYLLCRPDGYSERILTHGSLGRMMDLYEEIIRFSGIREVRQVFKSFLKGMNLTMASVSKVMFHDKSQSYLSTILNEDNRSTYSDDFVNEVFLDCKKIIDEGVIKIDGNTIQEKALLINDKLVDKPKVPKNVNEGGKSVKKSEEKSTGIVIVTNFDNKEQAVFDVKSISFKELNDFYLILKQVGAITENISMVPISDIEGANT